MRTSFLGSLICHSVVRLLHGLLFSQKNFPCLVGALVLYFAHGGNLAPGRLDLVTFIGMLQWNVTTLIRSGSNVFSLQHFIAPALDLTCPFVRPT